MEIKLWTVMYVGAVISFLSIIVLIYVVASTGDAGMEWMIWVLFGLTVALIVVGFLYEQRSKGAGLPRWGGFFGKEIKFEN